MHLFVRDSDIARQDATYTSAITPIALSEVDSVIDAMCPPRPLTFGGVASLNEPLAPGQSGLDMLRSRQREALRLRALGYSRPQIQQVMGVHPGTMAKLEHSLAGVDALAELNLERDKIVQEVRRGLLESSPLAVKLLKEIVQGNGLAAGDMRLRVRVAQDILDRVGARAPSEAHVRTDVTHSHVVGDEMLQKIKDTARLLAERSGSVVKEEPTMIDVTPTEVRSD